LPSYTNLTYAVNVEATLQDIRANIYSPWGKGRLILPLLGQFNLSNALAVLVTLCVYGIPFETALQHLTSLRGVPGRMQIIGGQQGLPLVVIDYAHTPDALEKVLEALRFHCRGRLICVFGCGGERDTSKRPLMAAAAERFADHIIVTSDNPRYESPEAIAAEIYQGFTCPERVIIELDREQAIGKSIRFASMQDCVLIAGKGAERYQQIGNNRIPFLDIEKAKKYLYST
jgi:UDP-N-acetylmuramoyl-L-alanyl-D-glutamate--2,6-diaminopimelate ligase